MSVVLFSIWNLIEFKDQLAVRMAVALLRAVVIPLIKETVLDIIHTRGLGMLIYCNLLGLLWMPFGWLIGFINNLQVVTTVSCNTVAGFTQFTNPTHKSIRSIFSSLHLFTV